MSCSSAPRMPPTAAIPPDYGRGRGVYHPSVSLAETNNPFGSSQSPHKSKYLTMYLPLLTSLHFSFVLRLFSWKPWFKTVNLHVLEESLHIHIVNKIMWGEKGQSRTPQALLFTDKQILPPHAFTVLIQNFTLCCLLLPSNSDLTRRISKNNSGIGTCVTGLQVSADLRLLLFYWCTCAWW